MNRQYRSKL